VGRSRAGAKRLSGATDHPTAAVSGPEVAPHEDRAALGLWAVMTLFLASSAILTRYCAMPAASIGFWRVTGASLVLSPWWLMTARRVRPERLVTPGALLTGAFLGVHFASWAWSLLNARVANAALFIALQPAVTPWLGRWMVGDRLSRQGIAGTVLACAGMAWVLGGQALFTPDQIPGSLMALFSMLCCAVYLTLGRRHRAREHVALFTVPVYVTAAAVQALAALLIDRGLALPSAPGPAAALAGLVLLPTVVGHTMALYLVKRVSAHTVALSVPVQFVAVAAAGTLLFGEWPSAWFYPGAAVAIAGVLAAIAAPPAPPEGPPGAAPG